MSIVSAPQDLSFGKESLIEGVPTTRLGMGFKDSGLSAHQKQKFTEKGKEFLKATRDENREKAFKYLMKGSISNKVV